MKQPSPYGPCSLPNFQDEYKRFATEFLGSLDTKIQRLLPGSVYRAVLTLVRQLRHKDWRARDRGGNSAAFPRRWT